MEAAGREHATGQDGSDRQGTSGLQSQALKEAASGTRGSGEPALSGPHGPPAVRRDWRGGRGSSTGDGPGPQRRLAGPPPQSGDLPAICAVRAGEGRGGRGQSRVAGRGGRPVKVALGEAETPSRRWSLRMTGEARGGEGPCVCCSGPGPGS
ncbi:unnamed protein product [Rangifer tarandus platyrhynchus]|uniref:Uncharacterized protein n=1 Tax=Rangifer tarandus platyrhynchus TaxID=3082113 RepID=A0AC59Z3T7_RANTA